MSKINSEDKADIIILMGLLGGMVVVPIGLLVAAMLVSSLSGC